MQVVATMVIFAFVSKLIDMYQTFLFEYRYPRLMTKVLATFEPTKRCILNYYFFNLH